MKQHKWHKEIKAWADGAIIEIKQGEEWSPVPNPSWASLYTYRIKPTIKTFTKYLNVYENGFGIRLFNNEEGAKNYAIDAPNYIKTIEITTEIEV